MNKTFSKKISDKEKEIILKYMKSHLKENNNSNIEYFFQTKKYSISIFFNKTLFIQGSDFNNILKMLDIKIESDKKSGVDINIGSDESGVGDLFGGIAIAAVKIPKENVEKLIALGIKDSKLLDQKFMNNIYDEILNLTTNYIVNISPIQYNEMYDKFKNINTIKTYGHNLAIKKIYEDNDNALIDQYTSLDKYKKHMKALNEKITYNLFLETKAESKYLEVACASILARVNFIKQINKIQNELKIKIPLGANPSNVNNTLNELKNKGINMRKYIKIHFKNNREDN